MIYQLHEHIHHHSLGYKIDDKLLRYILLQAYFFNKDADNGKKNQTILIYVYFIYVSFSIIMSYRFQYRFI